MSANAAFATGGSISRLMGAPLGGIAVGLGGLDAIVVLDAITFIAVAVAIAGVTSATPPATDANRDDSSGVREGWLAIRDRPTLVGYIVVQSCAQLAFAMFPVLFIKFVVDKLDGGGAAIGIIRGSAAFGALGGSLVIQRFGKQFDPRRLMLWGYAAFAVVAALFINAPAVTDVLAVYLVLFAFVRAPERGVADRVVGDRSTILPRGASRPTVGCRWSSRLGRRGSWDHWRCIARRPVRHRRPLQRPGGRLPDVRHPHLRTDRPTPGGTRSHGHRKG